MRSGWGRLVGIVTAVLTAVAGFGLAVPSPTTGSSEPLALMRVDLATPVAKLGLPVRAVLRDRAGVTYALVLAPASVGKPLGARVLDEDSAGARYLIALERREGARAEAARRFPVLLDDGRRIVVRDAPGRREELGDLGFDLGLFSEAPMALTPTSRAPKLPAITYDPRVADIIAAVTQAATYANDGDLSGETPVTIEGSPYTIATRHTSSGTPIQKATQYVYEYMLQYDLDPAFDNWTSGGYSGRNVVGEKLGSTHPDEIVLITAHLDDMPSGTLAPGADDNASGSVGVMMAAQILSQYWFERTIRFVFFTGEEQGLLGSSRYAAAAQAAGDNIVGVFNMDMIGWDQLDGPTLRLHTRTSGSAGYPDDLAIATMFNDVVSVYGLSGSLSPIIDSDGITASDHASFWSRGYPAILAIEDDQDDFNQYYHTTNDKREHLNMGYMTAYIKASLGTVAHFAVPSSAPCQQNMTALGIDVDTHPASGGTSNLNGLLEPGERVVLSPTWRYPDGCSPMQVIGTLSAFTGPTGFTFTVPDESAVYGFMMPGEETDCWSKGGNCYETGVLSQGQRPSTHVDLVATEDLTTNRTAEWTIHLGSSFTDVPSSRWGYSFIETLLHNGITTGCGASTYCPDATISRWEMAVFLAKAISDGAVPYSGVVPDMGDYNCVAGPDGMSVFSDVPPADSGCRFIHYIAATQVTSGCAAGMYCPGNPVDRWQMAIFIGAATAGRSSIPFSGTVPGMGDYNCVAGPDGVSVFSDVAADDGGCRFIHYLAASGITAGCGEGNYCPHRVLGRDEMAVFITKAFGLQLSSVSVE